MAKLKICGLTNPEDARLAEELGADYLGFVFYPGSPRFVEPRRVRDMRRPGGSVGALKVGVFVDESIAIVRRIFKESRLDLVQLHGDETPEYVRALGLPAWKALRAKDDSVLEAIHEYGGAVIVLDSYVEGRPGGTGRPFDAALVRRAVNNGAKIVVAGGVSEANIAEAVSLRPFAVDVSSSLEKAPGRKCEEKMRRFFETWRTLRSQEAESKESAPHMSAGQSVSPRKIPRPG